MNEISNNQDYTELMNAFYANDIKRFVNLIENGANINSIDRFGETVLGSLMRRYHGLFKTRNFFDILLKNGASLKQIGLEQGLLSMAANYHNNDYYLKKLLNNNINIDDFGVWKRAPGCHYNCYESALLTAIGKCNNDFINLLLKHKPDMNIETHQGETVMNHLIISYCTRQKHNDLLPNIKKLLKYGADPEAIGRFGFRAIHYLSIFNCNISLFEILIKNNINIDSKDSSKQTALKIAASNRNYKLSKFLIENGADIKIAVDMGYSPLIHENFKIFKLFYDNGLDLLKIDDNNNNLLHLIAKGISEGHIKGGGMEFKKYYEKISKLHPKLLDIKNSKGLTPSDIL